MGRELSHELAKDVQVGQSQSFSGGTSRQASEEFVPTHGPSPTGHMSFNFFGPTGMTGPPMPMGAQVGPCLQPPPGMQAPMSAPPMKGLTPPELFVVGGAQSLSFSHSCGHSFGQMQARAVLPAMHSMPGMAPLRSPLF